ncbi:MAG: cupin domain-containing protein [Pseudomonadota bacterium]
MTANTPTRPKPVINMDAVLDDPALSDTNRPGGAFDARLGAVGRALGTRKLGATVTVVAPGKKAWPRHYHMTNDEMFVVLSGTGIFHHGEDAYPLSTGDIAYGEAGTAIPFQIENTGTEDLRYLAISTLDPTDVFVYPDSGKIGFLAGSGPMRADQAGDRPRMIRFIKDDMKAGYWEGEL